MAQTQRKPLSRRPKSSGSVRNSLRKPMVGKHHCKTTRANPGRKRAGARMAARPKGKPSSKKGRKVTTGVKRLDELLMGGYPLKSAVLMFGDHFSGKETLENQLILAGLNQGAPGIILTNEYTSSEVRRKLQPLMPNFTGFEKKGTLKYIDAYTMSVKLKGGNPYATYVDSSKNLTDLTKGLATTIDAFGKKYFYYRIMVNSLTPILRKFGLEKTLNFLQIFLTRAKKNNAIVAVDLSEGVHPPTEITAVQELMDGVIEFKTESGRTFLRVKGLGETLSRDWVEYKHNERKFEVTGPFAVQKIA